MSRTRASLVAGAAALAGCGDVEPGGSSKVGAGVETAVVRTVTMGVPDASLGDNPGLKVFIDEVHRRSGGRMKIQVEAVGYEKETELPAALKAGEYDLVWARSRRFPEIAALSTLSAPFLVDSYALQDRLFESEFHEELLDSMREAGLRGVAMLPDWFYRPVSRTGRLRGPSDWEAIDGFATSLTDLRKRAIEALGVRRLVEEPTFGPTPAFNKGTATAGDMIVAGLVPNHLGAFGVYVTLNVATSGRVLIILGNAGFFDGLDSEERDWMLAAGRDATRTSLEIGERSEIEHLTEACRLSGVRVVLSSPEELRVLRERVTRVYDAVEDPAFRKAVDLIERERRETKAERLDVPEECRGELPPQPRPVDESTDPGALDGKYRYRTTKRDYVELGAEEALAEDEAGTFSVMLRAGKGELRRRSTETTLGVEPEPLPFTYKVDGARVSFDLGNAPVTMRWRKLRDGSLEFSSEFQVDPIFAPVFAATWRRVR